jgi:RNA polymerase sigma-70 factor, ECF subfamily
VPGHRGVGCHGDHLRSCGPGGGSCRSVSATIAAVEEADGAALERLLRIDAKVEATPWRTWFSGRATCVPYLVRQVLGSPGDWRLLPTSANGQPAAVGYLHGRAYGILVLTVTTTGIARVNAFAGPELVAKFGFPPTVDPVITQSPDGRG